MKKAAKKENSKKRKVWRYVLPIVCGFLALYFAAMGVATLLMKERMLEGFEQNFEQRLGALVQQVGTLEQALQAAEVDSGSQQSENKVGDGTQQAENEADGGMQQMAVEADGGTQQAENGAGDGTQQAAAETGDEAQEGVTDYDKYGGVLRDAYSGDPRTTQYQAMLGECLNLSATEYQQFSAALYCGGEMLAKSANTISATEGFHEDTGRYEFVYSADRLLSQEELSELAGYIEQSEYAGGYGSGFVPGMYRATMVIAEPETDVSRTEFPAFGQGWRLCRIIIQKITWVQGEVQEEEDPLTGSYHTWGSGKEAYHQTDSEIVWEWKNPDVEQEAHTIRLPFYAWQSFPYLAFGYDAWKTWTESEYLHDFPEYQEPVWYRYPGGGMSNWEEKKFTAQFCRNYSFGFGEGTKEREFVILLKSESHPWLAAMDYLKYAYAGSFAFLIACIVITVLVTGNMYAKRALLEETRRDFTNAVAHEMKTPLGVIRGLAENLHEQTTPEKTDYYLGAIIGQTEEMDRLVADMIYTSRLDSDRFTIKKEPLCWQTLVESQLKKFALQIAEKRICVQYAGDRAQAGRAAAKDDFLSAEVLVSVMPVPQGTALYRGSPDFEGDRDCLEKAIWNLLANAVHWCRPEGAITITLEKNLCSIENTGPRIAPERLSHIFEMLCRSEDGGLGMGLYLTERIAKLHGMNVTVENTEDGVRSTIGKF